MHAMLFMILGHLSWDDPRGRGHVLNALDMINRIRLNNRASADWGPNYGVISYICTKDFNIIKAYPGQQNNVSNTVCQSFKTIWRYHTGLIFAPNSEKRCSANFSFMYQKIHQSILDR